jgi:hypothetical protein
LLRETVQRYVYLDTSFDYAEYLDLMFRDDLSERDQDRRLQGHLAMVLHPISFKKYMKDKAQQRKHERTKRGRHSS